MANRFPLVLDVDSGNKIKELPSGDNLNLRESSIVNVQDVTALGTINAADIRVNGERLVAQQFADLTDTPAGFSGAEDYFVKVNSTGTALEFRPLSDIGNIEIDTLTVNQNITPSADNVVWIGTDANKLQRVTAYTLKGDLTAFDDTVVFDATTGKISYAALQGAPTNLSEFTDDVGFLRTVDLDDTLAGLFDEGSVFVTDIRGSVFADDSTMIVDGVAGVIRGDTEYTGTGFIRGETIVILADDTVQLGRTELTDAITPSAGSSEFITVGTAEIPFANGHFEELNVTNFVTETVTQGQGLGIGEISSSTDVSITAGNRVKIDGGVPFRVSSVTSTEQSGIAAQNGDIVYNSTSGFIELYQGSEWISLHQGTFTGNIIAATGQSDFNDVVVAGNLTVQGTTTTVDTANTTIKDNVIVLNNGEAGAGVTAGTSGIEIDRGSESNKTLVWDETDDKWTVGSEIFRAGTFEAVGFSGSIFYNGGQNAPLQIASGQNDQTGNTIFINPYGSDTFVQTKAETIVFATGPYSSLTDPYVQFKTAGAFEAKSGAYFVGDLTGNVTGDVVGSVFGDDSTTLVDAVNNQLNASKVITPLIEGPSNAVGIVGSLIALGSSHNITADAGPVTITSQGSAVYLTGAGGANGIKYDDSDASITLTTTGVTSIAGAASAAINIGGGASGTVTLGSGSNTVAFESGTTVDFDGATINNFNGNVDNATTLTLGAGTATAITIGNSGSTTTIEGTIQFTNALIANNLTADDSITIRTDGNTSGEAINLTPQGDNNAVNLVADNIRFFGPVTNEVEFTGGIVGDVKGTITGDDSTILVDGVNSKVVGPVDTNSLTVTGLSDTFQQYWLMVDANGNTSRYSADNVPYVSGMLTSTGTPENTLISGTVLAQGYDIVDPNLVNATGNLRGDVVGSVFADDSSVMVDAVEFAMFSDTLTLTPLNSEPANIVDGMIAIADGVGWDPLTTGVQTMMVRLGGAWRQIQTA